MGESKQYQFRAPADLQGDLQKVWVNKQSNTENLIRIVRAGVNHLMIREVSNGKPDKAE